MIIHLIGPGGAGKSTTGKVLANRLNFSFIDLDDEYLKISDINLDIKTHGYPFYVRKNIELYIKIVSNVKDLVLATSSGFMTYQNFLHTKISDIHKTILSAPNTILLLPSFDMDECAQIIVNRQLSRLHTNHTENTQLKIITERFPIYSTMGKIKIHTNRPVSQVVDKIMTLLEPLIPADPLKLTR